jgi:hypothetical protein
MRLVQLSVLTNPDYTGGTEAGSKPMFINPDHVKCCAVSETKEGHVAFVLGSNFRDVMLWKGDINEFVEHMTGGGE